MLFFMLYMYLSYSCFYLFSSKPRTHISLARFCQAMEKLENILKYFFKIQFIFRQFSVIRLKGPTHSTNAIWAMQ